MIVADKVKKAAASRALMNLRSAGFERPGKLILSLRTRRVEKCFLSSDIRIIMRV
jgi:hypothetical protein